MEISALISLSVLESSDLLQISYETIYGIKLPHIWMSGKVHTKQRTERK